MSSAYLHSCTTRPNPEKRTKFQMHRRTTPPKKRGYDPAAELLKFSARSRPRNNNNRGHNSARLNIYSTLGTVWGGKCASAERVGTR